jgi:hypothetical protein
VFEVLRALAKGRGGGWACVGGVCASVTATLQCNGHHSRVPVPRLEVQTPIRKRDRRAERERERKGDMTEGHMDRSGGGASHQSPSFELDPRGILHAFL